MKITFCKKQYLYLALATISLCLALTASVFAQVPDARETPLRNAIGQNGQREPGALRAKLDERVQNRLINLVRNATHRMESAILRLENITERLESRMDKLQDAGVDSPTAREYLKDAKGKLTEARQQLNEARTFAENAATSDDSLTQFKNARERFTNIRVSIKDAYALIRESLELLKAEVKATDMGTGASSAVSDTAAERAVETTPTATDAPIVP